MLLLIYDFVQTLRFGETPAGLIAEVAAATPQSLRKSRRLMPPCVKRSRANSIDPARPCRNAKPSPVSVRDPDFVIRDLSERGAHMWQVRLSEFVTLFIVVNPIVSSAALPRRDGRIRWGDAAPRRAGGHARVLRRARAVHHRGRLSAGKNRHLAPRLSDRRRRHPVSGRAGHGPSFWLRSRTGRAPNSRPRSRSIRSLPENCRSGRDAHRGPADRRPSLRRVATAITTGVLVWCWRSLSRHSARGACFASDRECRTASSAACWACC